MKKVFLYIAFFAFLFASCGKLSPLKKLDTTDGNPTLKGGNNSQQTTNGDEDKSDRPDSDKDLDLITDPNNDEDYDGEGKKPVVGNATHN